MLKNWYIATFAILLTAVGVGFVPFSVPNQELVVQFDEAVSGEIANAAIDQVSEKLEKLGAEDVKIKHLPNGTLKITYFSDISVATIQEVFASHPYNILGDKNTTTEDYPLEESLDYYKCVVSEIGGDNAIDKGLEGHLLDIETKSNRFYPPEFFFTSATNNEATIVHLANISEKINSQLSSFVDYTSFLLPETRAGPSC